MRSTLLPGNTFNSLGGGVGCGLSTIAGAKPNDAAASMVASSSSPVWGTPARVCQRIVAACVCCPNTPSTVTEIFREARNCCHAATSGPLSLSRRLSIELVPFRIRRRGRRGVLLRIGRHHRVHASFALPDGRFDLGDLVAEGGNAHHVVVDGRFDAGYRFGVVRVHKWDHCSTSFHASNSATATPANS